MHTVTFAPVLSGVGVYAGAGGPVGGGGPAGGGASRGAGGGAGGDPCLCWLNCTSTTARLRDSIKAVSVVTLIAEEPWSTSPAIGGGGGTPHASGQRSPGGKLDGL